MNFKSLILGTTVLATGFVATGAVAQQDEIVITATKREQTLQEVPVAVTVTDAETIENAQILDVNDLQSVVPSLRVTTLQNSQNTNFLIRGFGNGANNAGIEPSVGVFIDGVYRSRSAAQIADLPKLERVEVLRGPQSTLFGKNSSAGVISVVTSRPSFEQEGYVEAGIGNYNQALLRGYYTNAMSDNAAFSIAGGMNQRDGYAESADGSSSPDLGNRDRWYVRGQVLLQPTDNLEFRIIGDVSQLDEACCLTGLLDAANGLSSPDENGERSTIFGVNIIQAIQLGLGGNINHPFDYTSDFNGPFNNYVDDAGVSLHADWDLGNMTLTSITAYRNNDAGYSSEVDYTSSDLISNVTVENDIKTFTQELRLTSTGDGPIQWLLGGYYFDESIDGFNSLTYGDQVRAYADILTDGLGAPNALAGIEQANGIDIGTFFTPGTGSREEYTQDNTSFSLFGTVDWEVTDRLTLTFGGNYTEDEKDIVFNQTLNTDSFAAIDLAGAEGAAALTASAFAQAFVDNTPFTEFNDANLAALLATPTGPATVAALQAGAAAVVGATPLDVGCNTTATPPRITLPDCNPLLALEDLQFLPPIDDFTGNSNDDDFTYVVRAAYDLTDSVNVYASYATGFKATSWNLSRDTTPNARFADPEESEVIELGLKAQFERGAVNVAVFDQNIQGFQSNLFQGTGFVLANAGEQSVRGAEIEATFSPVESLVLTFAGTFLDPEFDSFENAPGPFGTVIDRTGDTPTGIHETSISTSATYYHDFGNGTTGFIRGDYLYESPTQIVPNFTSLDELADAGFIIVDTLNGFSETEREVSSFNASAGVSFENGLDVQVWGRNIFDDEYLLSAFPGVGQPGTVYGYPNQPSTYGLTVRKNF